MVYKYRVAGTAFDGDPFNETEISQMDMRDFVWEDVNDLVGGDRDGWLDMNILWVNPTKVLIEGQGRIYLIEQLGEATKADIMRDIARKEGLDIVEV